MEFDEQIALYYPFTDTNDASFAKTAALYWDQLKIICVQSSNDDLLKLEIAEIPRPGNTTVFPYNSQFTKEAYKEGFIKLRMIRKDDTALEKAVKEFSEDIAQEPAKQRMITLYKNINKEGWWMLPNEIAPLDYFWNIFESFVSNDSPDVRAVPIGRDYLIIPGCLGNAYLCHLASIIAQNDNIIPLTNRSLFQNALIDRFIDYSTEQKQNQSQLARLSLRTIAVNPDVPLIEILKFRDKHRKELISYRKHIRKLVREISKGLNDSEKQVLFEEMVKEEFLPVKKEIEAKISENSDWFVINNMAIMVVGVGAIILIGGQAWLASLLQGTVALGINVLGNIRDDRKCSKDHPLGYLYQAQKKFGRNQ